jgi:mono/diheme cytochrome c family protein
MEKILFTIALAGLLMSSCKPKQAVAKTSASEPTEAQLTALKTKMPAATMDDLKKGRSIFYGACTNCHGAKDVTGYTEADLQKVVNGMSQKASLSDPDRDAVWKYALAVNLSAKK